MLFLPFIHAHSAHSYLSKTSLSLVEPSACPASPVTGEEGCSWERDFGRALIRWWGRFCSGFPSFLLSLLCGSGCGYRVAACGNPDDCLYKFQKQKGWSLRLLWPAGSSPNREPRDSHFLATWVLFRASLGVRS